MEAEQNIQTRTVPGESEISSQSEKAFLNASQSGSTDSNDNTTASSG